MFSYNYNIERHKIGINGAEPNPISKCLWMHPMGQVKGKGEAVSFEEGLANVLIN